ncbi:hypothetical protein [Mesorhizobium sp. B2-3-6]|uniref:hypothetical protein n=1 Tax=Mesorhizobium sp. B2-3-6 TaxID=2589957 RepID=UPI0011263E0F|nr:hypothetical protein [Mesorhizobium sp. B2-3-6]TPM19763.1 hypothetical protein FJ953_15290 [Mesorhizobium sp. B2-3-6]
MTETKEEIGEVRLARCILRALTAGDRDAFVQPDADDFSSVDRKVVIDGRFDILKVAKELDRLLSTRE